MNKADALRELHVFHDELVKYQHLSRSFMNAKQMIAVDEIMKKISVRMRNIKNNLAR